ncbi:nucleotidyltransferase substrate binding protein (TIGR01987 family) [Melghiribacillus thermohalophilus]|uniref:Nucleotidyltransferase substrate binding protein (TIGR01987 family) n=1 Tax=Melghiribacillus thermohalophilus TaxID=1324956 RepID=A0A4R3N8F6_9BACI|nr:nucleotidyltransferase substrate binding protein [Melghiribacillus thermohalophilus]TCT25458.1 nucleotidyltransferase substrate binding protein (TIGR01987 family) [Melghiribacillus thermohalophilus]
MSSDAEIRWKQFLENYEKALKELNKHKDTVFESNLEKAGYIHYFEIALEFAHKVMLAYLEAKGKPVEDPREAVMELEKLGMVQNKRSWFRAQNRKKLPLYLHKNEKLFDELIHDINDTYLPELAFLWRRLCEMK